MEENEKLNFKPLSEGLGFHPFSDGLPYAPHSKTVSKSPAHSSGTGAVAAGPARIIAPTKKFSSPSPSVSTPHLSPSASPAAGTVTTIQPPAFQKTWIEQNILGAPTAFYPIKRFTAFVLDTLLHLCLMAVFMTFFAERMGIQLDGSEPMEFFVLVGVLISILNHSLTTLQELIFQTSFGKSLAGLQFYAAPIGRILLRSFLFPLSLLTAGLGILLMFVEPKKRMLHDILSGVQPLEK